MLVTLVPTVTAGAGTEAAEKSRSQARLLCGWGLGPSEGLRGVRAEAGSQDPEGGEQGRFVGPGSVTTVKWVMCDRAELKSSFAVKKKNSSCHLCPPPGNSHAEQAAPAGLSSRIWKHGDLILPNQMLHDMLHFFTEKQIQALLDYWEFPTLEWHKCPGVLCQLRSSAVWEPTGSLQVWWLR